MSAPPYMKLFWGDYHKKTRHLTKAAHHGAYMLLIGEAWQNGGSLPDDDALLAPWAACNPDEWASIKPLVMGFFSLRRGKWVHDRVREELAAYESTSRKRKEAGKAGGSASRGKDAGNPKAIAKKKPTKPKPEPEPDKEELTLLSPTGDEAGEPKVRYPELFERAWSAYPHVKGRSSKKKSHDLWRRLHKTTQAALPHACGRYAMEGREPKMDGGAAAMERWLRDEKFADWMTDTAPAGGALASIPKFPNAAIREYVVQQKGEPWAVSYLDSCAFSDADGARTITAPNSFTAGKLRSDVPALEQRGVAVVVEQAQPHIRSVA